MTRTTTLALLGLACLMATPPIAQGRYLDGMNLYEYVRSNPTINLDPSGELTVQRRDRHLNAQCGEQVWASWDFVLDSPARRRGTIVQMVEVACLVERCKGGGKSSSMTLQIFRYWEKWSVGLNQTYVTDTFGKTVNDKTCGMYYQTGTVKFFYGTLGRLWRRFRTYGKGPCQTNALGLRSTRNKPGWWNNAPDEGPAYREGAVYWNCCGKCNNVHAEAHP